jgi:phosphoserine phosphatase
MTLNGFLPEVAATLEEFLSAKHPPGSVATFDLDGTCVHHDTGEALFYAMAKRGLFELEALRDAPEVWAPFARHPGVPNPRSALLDRLRDPSKQSALAYAFIQAYHQLLTQAGRPTAYLWAGQVLCGKTPDQVRALSMEVIVEELGRPVGSEAIVDPLGRGAPIQIASGLRSYEPVVELLRRIRAAGIAIWMVSATNRWTVEVYAGRFLEVPPERILGIAPQAKGGRITAAQDPGVPITGGPGKVEAIDRFIGRRPIFSAGDSMGDWEMLCATEGPRLVIDRGSQELLDKLATRRKAGETGWLLQPRFIDPP